MHKQSIRVFLIAFGAGIIIFGIFAFLMFNAMMGNDKTEIKDNNSTPVMSGDTENKNDDNVSSDTSKTFTAIVGGYDGTAGELDALLFIKADKENRKFVIASVPAALSVVITSTDPSTEVSVNTEVRLKDFPIIFGKDSGRQKIIDTMRAMTGMKIDYYAFFDINSATNLLNKTGKLYFEIPQDMFYIGTGTEENPEINLKAGAHNLNAEQIIDLLRFSGYTSDENRNNAFRASLHSKFIPSAIEQVLNNIKIEDIVSGIPGILSGLETNFGLEDFTKNLDLIIKFGDYKSNSSFITVDLPDPIDYTSSQKLFENYK